MDQDFLYVLVQDAFSRPDNFSRPPEPNRGTWTGLATIMRRNDWTALVFGISGSRDAESIPFARQTNPSGPSSTPERMNGWVNGCTQSVLYDLFSMIP